MRSGGRDDAAIRKTDIGNGVVGSKPGYFIDPNLMPDS